MLLEHFEVGQGHRPTVLLHGFLGSGKNLRTLALKWSERDPSRRFLLPDLPGHGASPPPAPDTDLRAMGRAVLDTARDAGLTGPLTWVGHSLGGRVALGASLAQPEAVDEVVLLDIAPGPVANAASQSRRVLDVLLTAPDEAAERRTLRQSLLDGGLDAPTSDWLMMNVVPEGGRFRWRFDRRALSQLHERVNQEDLWSALERPGSRVRCIRGERSPYVSEADAARMRDLGCPVETLGGAGHHVHVDALGPLLDLLAR